MAADLSAFDPESIVEPMLVERPRGTHLGPASDSNGLRPMARDNGSNAVETHVRLHPLDPSGTSEEGLNMRSAAIGGAIVLGAVGVVVVGKRLAPQARRAWSQRAVPALRSAFEAATGSRKRDSHLATQETIEMEAVSGDVVEDERVEMSSAEARERLAAALLARAFSDEQMRLLHTARVIDGVDPADVERSLHLLTPQQLSQGSRLILENGPLEDLRQLLGFGQHKAERLPHQVERGRV